MVVRDYEIKMYAAITKSICAWNEEGSGWNHGNVKKHRVTTGGRAESCSEGVFVDQDRDPDRKLQRRYMGVTLEEQIAKAMRGENGTVVIPPAAAHECAKPFGRNLQFWGGGRCVESKAGRRACLRAE